MQCFLVLFVDRARPPIPENANFEHIEFGSHAYIVASDKLTTDDLRQAFYIGTEPNQRDARNGMVVRMDVFKGYANSSVVERVATWLKQ